MAHCSLEDVQTCRVLEVPLWMLDVAACCKTRVSRLGFASAQSLRELKEVVQSVLPRAQSSAYQVQNNLESQKLQYAMRDRLCSLGWRDIEVVDEDLGVTGIRHRDPSPGFARMVAEVCLGPCGVVRGLEVSRLATQQR